MDPNKKKIRDRKRKSRALASEFKADMEVVFDASGKDSHCLEISHDGTDMDILEEDSDYHHRDDLPLIEEASVSGDVSLHERSSPSLPDELLTENLRRYSSSTPPSDAVQLNSEERELREWAINENIKHASVDKLLTILRRRLLPDLPKSAVTFLQTRKIVFNIRKMSDYSIHAEYGKFVYFGIAHGLMKCIIPDHVGDIALIINMDGLPLSKSGKKNFWPILCRVYYKPDFYKPFPVAIYYGASKPKNISDYLDEFIGEMNHLQAEGIVLHEKHYDVHLMCIAADTPARAYCKGTKGHGGYNACERCVVRGRKVNKGRGSTMVYPGINHSNRDDASFRERCDPEHHIGSSPLENIIPRVDMTRIFSLDIMHLVFMGVTKKLLEMLLFAPLKVRLSRKQKEELSRRMLSLRASIPAEFQRKPTSIEWVHRWKATEYRFFLLYAGPIVLRFILSRDLYRHFLLLHAAFRILCSEELAIRYNDLAKSYLHKFFEALPLLYGEKAQVINMHNLQHVADDAIIFGCDLNKVSCFAFENCLGSIKRVLRTPNKQLEQFCNRQAEKAMLPPRPLDYPKKFEVHKSSIIGENVHVFKLKYNYSTIITTTPPNNIVLLKNGSIMQINEIYGANASFSSLKIAGKIWANKISLYKYPTKSSKLQIWKIPKNKLGIDETHSLTTVVKKLIKMNMSFTEGGSINQFFVAMVHT